MHARKRGKQKNLTDVATYVRLYKSWTGLRQLSLRDSQPDEVLNLGQIYARRAG
jgi:hypothetical protein